MYLTEITLQCNFSQLKYENKVAAGVNVSAVLEFASFPTYLWISPDKPLQVSRILPSVPQ